MAAIFSSYYPCFLNRSNLSNQRRAAGRCHVSHPPSLIISTVQNPSLKITKEDNNKKPFLRKDFSQNDYHKLLRWWEQLELSHQPHAFRNQPMKWFMWSTSALPDPHFSVQRIELSKVIALVYVIDDIFDLLGPLEELTLFTHAVQMWWEQLELSQQPQDFRDQPMKWFAWSMGVLPDPHFSMQRIELSKVIALVYVIDDIFDLLGSLEELTLFTRAVERWDNSPLLLDSLPAYMKFCLHALYNTTDEIADLIMKEHGMNNPIHSLRKLWASLFQAFLVEAQWFRSECPPAAKEYLENGVISTGVCVVLVHLNFLLGIEGNRKNVIVLMDDEKMPLLFSQAALILRLWDDLGSAEDENQEGFDGSYVDYYMKEHDISLQTARKHTNQMISDAWRELNKEILSENQVSSAMKKATLNMVNMIKIMYNYENHRFPILEE